MPAHRLLEFPPGRAPERLDRFLAEALPELTRSQLKRLIDDEQVLLAAAPVKAGLKLRGGERLSVNLPQPQPLAAQPEAIPLTVLYEDAHLIVIDKPAGLVVHPAPGHQGGTLVNALLHHCHDLAGIGGSLRPGIVHRLDKETSGVLVATKDDATHNSLARQFKLHTINRRYLALVHGCPEAESGTIDQAIGRHPVERKKMSSATRSGRRAVTHWRVRERFFGPRLALLELRLETGRTHQIRVHLSEQGFPVVGDPVYGRPGRLRNTADPQLRTMLTQLHRQFLHARLLGFVHPVTGSYMEFESPLPEDLAGILAYLEKISRSAAQGATPPD
ncbi:RluA family pseudouridine synthase [Desulfuromonas carbonis]|uniref:RluA family pseudouridine synthase n=1 Tax=Desulfuromonas sp. DDH964 TaxID=1823759 RepID=UPI00078C77F1|nr:RluA family pseudouridine synthase [Desulfuromonas sp. DDH964]AMV73535.1 23S rRNA synthase [Desulfuromonas sp. DDH964]